MPMRGTIMGLSSTYHIKDAAREQKRYNWAMERVNKDIKRGDLKSAANDKYWADVHKRRMDTAVSLAKTAIKNKK